MRDIGNRLLGDPAHFSFDKRVFHLGILLGTVMTLAAILNNLYLGCSFVIDIIFAGCWIISYYLSRFRGCFGAVSIISIGILVFAFIPYIWISSRGSTGAVHYYAIIFIAVICIVLKGYLRLFMVVSVMLVHQLLILYEAGSIKAIFQISFLKSSFPLSLMTAAMAILIIIYSNTYMKEKERSEAYAKTIEEHYREQLYYMENLEALIYKLKSERHDFNNHLGVIYGLLENGETDKARVYGAQLIKAAEKYRNMVNLPYSMIRAMLNYKLSGAEEEGIRLRLGINVAEGLSLNEFDMTVILGNLLDNAVEACKNVEEDKRYISLDITYKPDYLVIKIENPTDHLPVLKHGDYRTTKPDGENHGFGLGNIAYLVSRYNGLMKIEPEDGIFRVNIALLVK